MILRVLIGRKRLRTPVLGQIQIYNLLKDCFGQTLVDYGILDNLRGRRRGHRRRHRSDCHRGRS